MERRSSWENQLSTALSQEALVGVKCRWKRSRRAHTGANGLDLPLGQCFHFWHRAEPDFR